MFDIGERMQHKFNLEDIGKGKAHICRESGCKMVKYYKQMQNIDTICINEDYLIRQTQALISIRSLSNKRTTFIKYFNRISYILLKYGNIGFHKDTNGLPIFGKLYNAYYNVVGDVIKFDIEIKNWGLMTTDNPWYYSWNMIKNNAFAIELPRKKGLKASYLPLLQNVQDAFFTIRVNLANSMIKYYYKVGNLSEDEDIDLITEPSMDNFGIAMLKESRIPINLKNNNNQNLTDEEKKLQNHRNSLVNRNKGELLKNDYNDSTNNAINNFDFAWKMLTLHAGIREKREIKKGNQHNLEVLLSNFSYDIAENYILQVFQELVENYNEMFGEDNVIEKAFDSEKILNDIQGSENEQLL